MFPPTNCRNTSRHLILSSRCPSSPTWNVPARAAPGRSTHASDTTYARAGLRCWRATTWRGRGDGSATRCATACRACGGIARYCPCSAVSSPSRSVKASPRSCTARASARRWGSTACTSRTNRSIRRTRSKHAGNPLPSRGRAHSVRARCRCPRPGTPGPRWRPTPHAPGSRRACSCRATSSGHSRASASSMAHTSRWWTG